MEKSVYSARQQMIADTIKKMRRDAHLTQRQLAARLKSQQTTVNRMENGDRRIDFLDWIAVCKACGVNPAAKGHKVLVALAEGKF